MPCREVQAGGAIRQATRSATCGNVLHGTGIVTPLAEAGGLGEAPHPGRSGLRGLRARFSDAGVRLREGKTWRPAPASCQQMPPDPSGTDEPASIWPLFALRGRSPAVTAEPQPGSRLKTLMTGAFPLPLAWPSPFPLPWPFPLPLS
jgi:hypothetical protein